MTASQVVVLPMLLVVLATATQNTYDFAHATKLVKKLQKTMSPVMPLQSIAGGRMLSDVHTQCAFGDSCSLNKEYLNDAFPNVAHHNVALANHPECGFLGVLVRNMGSCVQTDEAACKAAGPQCVWKPEEDVQCPHNAESCSDCRPPKGMVCGITDDSVKMFCPCATVTWDQLMEEDCFGEELGKRQMSDPETIKCFGKACKPLADYFEAFANSNFRPPCSGSDGSADGGIECSCHSDQWSCKKRGQFICEWDADDNECNDFIFQLMAPGCPYFDMSKDNHKNGPQCHMAHTAQCHFPDAACKDTCASIEGCIWRQRIGCEEASGRLGVVPITNHQCEMAGHVGLDDYQLPVVVEILEQGAAQCQKAATAADCHSTVAFTDADEAKIRQGLESVKTEPTSCPKQQGLASASVQMSLRFSVIHVAVIAFAMELFG